MKNIVLWLLLTLIKHVKVLMAATVKNNLLCNVTTCSPVKIWYHFGGTWF